jgi:hypothetical protein
MPREEDAWINEDGNLSYLTGPQMELWLVGAGR